MINTSEDPEVIFYGGAFDPPHQGHVDCVQLALHRFPKAQLWLCPAKAPAGQNSTFKTPFATFEDRLAMCKLIMQDVIGVERIVFSEIENQLPEPNYTINALEELVKVTTSNHLGLLIGQDQIAGFSKWKDPKKILNLASLIAIRRESISVDGGNLIDVCEKTLWQLGFPLEWDVAGKYATIDGLQRKIYLINEKISIAESHLIRDFFYNKKNIPSTWISKDLMQFIKNKKLYS